MQTRDWALWIGLIVQKSQALEPGMNHQRVHSQVTASTQHGPEDAIQVRVEMRVELRAECVMVIRKVY